MMKVMQMKSDWIRQRKENKYMSKYKVGDKFIIEIAEVYENVLSGIYGFKAATS